MLMFTCGVPISYFLLTMWFCCLVLWKYMWLLKIIYHAMKMLIFMPKVYGYVHFHAHAYVVTRINNLIISVLVSIAITSLCFHCYYQNLISYGIIFLRLEFHGNCCGLMSWNDFIELVLINLYIWYWVAWHCKVNEAQRARNGTSTKYNAKYSKMRMFYLEFSWKLFHLWCILAHEFKLYVWDSKNDFELNLLFSELLKTLGFIEEFAIDCSMCFSLWIIPSTRIWFC